MKDRSDSKTIRYLSYLLTYLVCTRSGLTDINSRKRRARCLDDGPISRRVRERFLFGNGSCRGKKGTRGTAQLGGVA